MANFCVSSDRLNQAVAALEERRLGLEAQRQVPADGLAARVVQVEGGVIDLPGIAAEADRLGGLMQEVARINQIAQGLRQVPCLRSLAIAAGVAGILGVCGVSVALILHAGDAVTVGSGVAGVCSVFGALFGASRVERRLEAYRAYRAEIEVEGPAPEPAPMVEPDLGLPVDENGIIIE